MDQYPLHIIALHTWI